MLREAFIGKNPSQFHVNAIVKAFIISESFLWSAWNFITPIFAVFVVTSIKGGSIELAATGFSIYLVTRVLFELITGRFLLRTDDNKKLSVAIFGIACLSLSYLGFAMSSAIIHIFLSYVIAGIGLGITSPAKNSLFSLHLDKNKEATEWGIADAVSFMCTALAAVLGGFIASRYGFDTLFIIASIVNSLSIVPYAIALQKK